MLGIDVLVTEALRTSIEWARNLSGRQIQIASPRTNEVFPNKLKGSGGWSYEVRGTLKHLPANHEIWLLKEEQGSTRVWPQGFQPVTFDPITKEWSGRIFETSQGVLIKVIAVIAPPSSQDFFKYYQNVGQETNYEPLERIPPECRNQAYVHAWVR